MVMISYSKLCASLQENLMSPFFCKLSKNKILRLIPWLGLIEYTCSGDKAFNSFPQKA